MSLTAEIDGDIVQPTTSATLTVEDFDENILVDNSHRVYQIYEKAENYEVYNHARKKII